MSTPTIALTGAQKNQIHKALDKPALSPNFAATGEINPHLRVFVVNFDGTENNGSDVKDGAHQTLVATLSQNIVSSKTLQARYYSGVGVGSNYLLSKLDAATGFGCKAKADEAYLDLVHAAEQWRREDPLVQVHVHVVGFSRGAATALHFMNKVDKLGIEPVRPGHYAYRPVPKSFLPGAVKTSAVLLDAVATGQSLFLDLALPQTAVSVLHLVAGSEERTLFPLTPLGAPDKLFSSDWSLVKGVKSPVSTTQFGDDGSFLYQRLHQISLNGARHSDVGDAYGDGYLGRVAQYLALEFQGSLGLPVPAAIKPHFSDIQKSFGHDSRYLFDKIVHGVSEVLGVEVSRETVTRQIKSNKPAPWNGDLIQTASLKLVKDGVTLETRKMRLRIALEPGETPPTERECNKRHRLEYHPASVTRPLRFSSRMGLFKIDHGPQGTRLLFNNVPIDDLDVQGAQSIFKRVLDPTSGLDLHVDISYKKQMVPLTDVGQRIARGATLSLDRRDLTPDPWPLAIRESIKVINGYGTRSAMDGSLTQADALLVMSRCMAAAADTLKQEFPDTEKVRIRHRSIGQTGFMGAALGPDEISISCQGVPGHFGNEPGGQEYGPMFTSRSKSTTANQYALKARIQDMSEALSVVRECFRNEGFEVLARGADHILDMKPKLAPAGQMLVEEVESEADANQLHEAMTRTQSANQMQMH